MNETLANVVTPSTTSSVVRIELAAISSGSERQHRREHEREHGERAGGADQRLDEHARPLRAAAVRELVQAREADLRSGRQRARERIRERRRDRRRRRTPSRPV